VRDGHAPCGRQRELAHLVEFLVGGGAGARALVVEGEAGIGKTTIWRAALEQARADGAVVLVAQPTEDELPAGLLGLRDLFDGTRVDPVVLAEETDVFDRGRAVLAALRTMSAHRPVVIGVDDVQWLDARSVRALRYALRRMDGQPVRVLATRRSGPAWPDLVEADRLEIVALGPLALDDLRRAVAPVAAAVSRPAMVTIHQLSGGNPMYALELARDPRRRGSLRDALAARLAALPPDVLGVVRTAAAIGPSSPEAIVAAGGGERPALDAAVDLGLLTVDEHLTVRGAHPLVASVALDGMASEDRRQLHARLAAWASDPDAHAHHLAMATTERDGAAAAVLEEAADRAGQRGAPAAAADLAAHSVRLTPVGDRSALARRAVAEILHRAAAGETARAIAMVDAIAASLPPGRERFAALALRVGLDFGEAEAVLARAEADAPDELTRGRILDLRAYGAYMYRGDLRLGATLAAAAREIAVRAGDPTLEMLASATLGTVALLTGEPRPELLARAIQLGQASGTFRLGRWPEVEQARQSVWAGHLGEARALFDRLFAMTARSGLEFQRPYRLVDLANLELAAGNLSVACRLAEDGIESATDAGNGPIIAWLRYPDGLAAAHLGDHERARAAADAMCAWGTERAELPRLLMAHHVFGLDALARQDLATARRELDRGLAVARRTGQAHPGVVPVLPDALEAAAAGGDAPSAAALAAELGRQADALALPWVDAAARRGRGLATLVAGGAVAAVADLAAAAAAFDELGYALDAARAVRWQGLALARAGSPAASERALSAARRRFESLQARPWAEQTPTRGSRPLSDTDRRVVELVAAGRRNREIAGDLHVSVGTVEAALTRIYRTVGVRSRAELARWAGDRPGLAPEVSGTVVS
jgi:DNA-binding CsgD family transcriptional regulator